MNGMLGVCSLYNSDSGGCSTPPTIDRERSTCSRYRERSTSLSSDSNSGKGYVLSLDSHRPSSRKKFSEASAMLAKSRSRNALKFNDSMVYLDGPQVYTCNQCRTHLTSHDDIISKSFHGRHGRKFVSEKLVKPSLSNNGFNPGRAYLFEHSVNIVIGPAEDRMLITGLHSVCDIFCKRCKKMVGWTYAKAYEPSQKYKEGKFIIEKINLHLEESHYFHDVRHPAGERPDKWRKRSMMWGSDPATQSQRSSDQIIYEYYSSDSSSSSLELPHSPYSEKSLTGLPGKSPVSVRYVSRTEPVVRGPPAAPAF